MYFLYFIRTKKSYKKVDLEAGQ